MSALPKTDTPQASAIRIWPAPQLRANLCDPDASRRRVALAMAVLPDAPAGECIGELIDCTKLPDAQAQCLAAVALGGQPAGNESALALAHLLEAPHASHVRIAAAHGLYRTGRVPATAHAPLAAMLLLDEAPARQVAQLALTRAEAAAGDAVAHCVGITPPERWTTELLASLAHFARDDGTRRKLDAWLIETVRRYPLLPTGIAGFTALAAMAGGGIGLDALLRVAAQSPQTGEREAALEAIGSLGKTASGCAQTLAHMLDVDGDPAIEVLVCQTLVRVGAPAEVLPQARIAERIRSGEPRLAAAHAMLATLAGKPFAALAGVLAQRHALGPVVLRPALAAAYKTLSGLDMPEAATE